MDDFDRSILNILQINSRMSTEKMGDFVGLSPSACQRRIKKLKAQGIIKKEVAIIDRDKLEGLTTAIIDVSLEKGGERALDGFIDMLNNEKRVQQVYYTAGDVDFVLIIVVRNMSEFDSLTRRLLMSNCSGTINLAT
ncbi:Lrp/AsnC family transcriptional regulator [Flocculibacter collagenilyticus]|uniref:Lrp/AsnC family transcriptional regulator n=1 Tax=Flocculibacter collagenilyticus TaxID=2744479 RepID=UPI0018F54837|nr:Lrp/AsnC family transcriptional regulator [Flocculibacter collagenilyticus]